MLNVSQAMVADAVKAYFAASDYFVNDYNPPGVWGGKLMEEFGLEGTVDKQSFDLLADGHHPATGEDLVLNRITNRRSANDITISAPKDFSLLYLAADPEMREKLMAAFTESCDWVMGQMEGSAATRVRVGKADYDRRTGNWGYAGFVHLESRPDAKTELPVIQIHRHHTVFNLTRDPEEQRIKALQIGEVKKHADFWMPLFHNELARHLRDLGYGIRKERGTGIVGFAIDGVPRELVMRHSPRRLTILEAKKSIADKEGITDPKRLRALQADLAKLTRKHKQKDLDHAALWKVWQRMLTPDDRKALAAAHGREGWVSSNEEAAGFAIDHLFEKQSVIEKQAEKKLLIEALRYGVGSVDVDGLCGQLRRQGVLYVGEEGTTRKTLVQEQFIVEFARAGMGRERPVVARPGSQVEAGALPKLGRDVAGVARAAPDTTPTRWQGSAAEVATLKTPVQQKRPGRGDPGHVGKDTATLSPGQQAISMPDHIADVRKMIGLSPEQSSAVSALLTSTNAVNVVDAGQGTGKTTMLDEYGKALTAAGVGTTWLGTTHTAVEELRKVGRPAMTVAAFLHSAKEQEKAHGHRLVIDEASMLSHKDCYDLTVYAQANGNRLDLVGDSKQYKTPSAGHPMKLLTQFGGVKPITMTETKRQTGKLKAAMEAIRDNRELKGHDLLGELGMIHEMPREELAQRAADLYLEWTRPGESIPCVSPTHAQAAEIAEKIREGLRARGDLKGDDHIVKRLVNLGWSVAQLRDAKKNGAEGVTLGRYGAYREESLPLAVGDKVRTTMTGASKDGKHRINNGQRYTVAGFSEDGDPILNNGWVVDKDWGGLNQDYVSTGQGSQGKTAWHGIVVYGTPSLVATRHEGFYVPVSRVRKEVAVLTDSNEELRKAIQRRESKKLAVELFPPQQIQPPQRRRPLDRFRTLLRKARDRFKLLHAGVGGATKGREHKKERHHGYSR